MATSTSSRFRPGSSANYLSSIADGGSRSPEAITRILTNAFGAEDYYDCIKNLRGASIDPQSYVDGLDKAIDIISPESDIYERWVRELRKTCGIYGMLPDSHTVKSVLTPGPRAVVPGGFSDVWKAENENREVFAIKVLRMYQDNAELVKRRYCKEVIISKRMDHPNVLQIEGVAPGLFECCMVSRWMERGNMLEYLNQAPETINRLELLFGVIRGLRYLHTHKVVHGDLKGHNILIDKLGNPCLADFGLSSVAEGILSVSGSTDPSGGSIRWAAPELIGLVTPEQGRWVRPTTQSDIYSLAMVIVEVFTGQVPFPKSTSAQVVHLVSKGGRPPKPQGCEELGFGPEVWELTEDCWDQDRAKRPDVATVYQRFREIMTPGLSLTGTGDRDKPSGGGSTSPGIFRWKPRRGSVQERINKLDQDLEKGVVPEKGWAAEFNELCKLCSNHRLIPDSMKLQDCEEPLEMRMYGDPSPVYQNMFKGRKVAIKVIWLHVPQKLDEPLSRFCKEVVMWKHLRHPNILPLLGAMIDENRLSLVSEWMDQGNINEYLKPRERNEVNRIELLADVVDGLSYMHDHHVVHGNMKGANIYIRNFRACIADFGISTIARLEPWVGSSRASTISLVSFTSGGSLPWMSPELVDPDKFNVPDPRPTRESDCFAMGMVIYEVLCGHAPYDGWARERINDAILQGVRPYKPKAAVHLGLVDELWNVLQRCWAEDREARPNLQTIRACLDEVIPLWHVRKDPS